MRSFSNLSFRLLGPLLAPDAKTRKETTRALRAARIGTFPEWYVAQSYLAAILISLATTLVAIAALWYLKPRLGGALLVLLVAGVAVVSFSLVRLAFLLYPRVRATGRAKRVDAEYQSAVVLCYALARGGMSVIEIFKVLAKEQETYGEISNDYAMVVRDVELFGVDLITALTNASQTTPSQPMRGFFEGLITILNSGADPRDYFKRQADVSLNRAEVEMEGEVEKAGLLAEVYVSSFLVLPLLLLVVLSGLSSLGNGQERFIPLVVYGIIPAGTLVYALVLEIMMPATELKASPPTKEELTDFGVDSLPADAERLPPPWKMKVKLDPESPIVERPPLWQRARSFFVRVGEHTRAWFAKQKEHYVTAPMDLIEITGTLAILLFLAAGFAIWRANLPSLTLSLRVTELLLLVGGVAFVPVAVFHEIRVRRARKVEAALPEMLSKLAGFNERGIGLLQSFQILGRSTSGNLAKELRSVERDVRVNGNLVSAIRRMRDRVKTMRMTKLGVLLERASQSTSNMKEVLDIAAADETRTESLRARKRQTMLSYVLVIYLVFGVFLYVTYMITSLFYGDAAFAIALGPTASGATRIGTGTGLAAASAKLLFLHAVVLQGVGCGLIAGRLGEGHMLSGVKHAAIMGGIALAVFVIGVV